MNSISLSSAYRRGFRSLLPTLLLLATVLPVTPHPAQCQESQSADQPPVQSTMTAAPVKRPTLPEDVAERIAEMEHRIHVLLNEYGKKDGLAEAIILAEEVLAIRQKYQGPEAGWTDAAGEPGEWYELRFARYVVEDFYYLDTLTEREYAELFEAFRQSNPEIPKSTKAGTEKEFSISTRDRYEQSERLFRQSLATRQRLLGIDHPFAADHPSIAGTMSDLGQVLRELGEFEESERLARKALEMRRNSLGEEHPHVAHSLNILAKVLLASGKFGEVEQLLRQSLTIRRRVLGDEHYEVAMNMRYLAAFLSDVNGDYASAESFLRQALTLYRRVVGDDHIYVATTLDMLAVLLEEKGDYGAAEPMHREVLRLRRKLLGDEHPSVAQSLNNLASVRQETGRYREAESLYREALVMRCELLGEEHVDVALSLNNLADLLEAKGDSAAAAPLYQQALTLRRKLLGDEHPAVAESLSSLAVLLEADGDYQAAEPLCCRALAMRRELLGDEHPDVASSLNQLARILNCEGDHLTAEMTWEAAQASFESARLRVGFSGLDRAKFTARYSPLLSLAACRARNNKALLAWQALEAGLARGLLDTISARETSPLDEEERNRKQYLIHRLGKLDEAIGTLSNTEGMTADSSIELESIQKERERLQTELARFEAEMLSRYGVEAGEVYELTRIQAHLSTDEALLAWADIKGHPSAADPSGEHWACLVRHNGDPVWVRLPGSGDNDAWTEMDNQLPGMLRDALSAPRPIISADAREELIRRIHAQRIAPLQAHLDGIDHLIVLPAGWMVGIPVESLTNEYTVSYAPSGTMYAWLKEKTAGTTGFDPGIHPDLLLALGDPTFLQPEEMVPLPEPPDHGVLLSEVVPGSHACLSGLVAGDILLTYGGLTLEDPSAYGPTIERAQSLAAKNGQESIPVSVWRGGETLELSIPTGRLDIEPEQMTVPEAILAHHRLNHALSPMRSEALSPLPASRAEVNAISALFNHPEAKGTSTILLGSEASEQRLDDLAASGKLQSYRYIHLATHGMMDNENAMNSAMILSQDNLPDAFERAAADSEIYDGRLTADQIVRTWELDADLVTLSGCETGLGRESGGEGFLGFSQALFVAGARSLLLSLWKVDDTATMLLMVRFYENMLGKHKNLRYFQGLAYQPGTAIPKAEALGEAKYWLKNLTNDEMTRMAMELPHGEKRGETETTGQSPSERETRPFADPRFWSSFILMGSPE